MKKTVLLAASVLVTGMMAGCGSGGSGAGVSAISGKVADGYLVNATVFMDKNGNYQLDAGEPSTTTDANGAYTLSVDPADVGKYPIVALAVQGVTMDKDTNKYVGKSYLLSMPKDSVSGTASSNFISPMSSQIREMMETGKYASVKQAMDALRAKLGMPAGTNVMADYLAGQNSAMHTAAQNMAALMGGQMTQIYGVSGGSTGIDVNRYRGMMGAIFSNMSSIKGQNAQGAMTTLMSQMTSQMSNIVAGMPFRNMSASFRGMMGGSNLSNGGGMMGFTGSTSTTSTGSTSTTSTGSSSMTSTGSTSMTSTGSTSMTSTGSTSMTSAGSTSSTGGTTMGTATGSMMGQ